MPSTANAWAVAIHQTLSGWDPIVNTFIALAPTLADPDDVANDCAAAWGDNDSFTKWQCNTLFITGITVRPLDGSSAGIDYSVSLFPNDNGQVAGTPIPPQVSFVIAKKSLVGGPKGRGRLYIAAMNRSSTNTNDDSWDSTLVSNMSAAANNWKSLMESGTATTGIGLPNKGGATAIVVSSVAARSYFGTQRRRVAGV